MFYVCTCPGRFLLPPGAKLCCDFAFKGRECVRTWPDPCPRGLPHIWHPSAMKIDLLEAIGDRFLETGSGGFVARAFKNFDLKPKYKSLLTESNSNTFKRA